jgi:hypothetical protein
MAKVKTEFESVRGFKTTAATVGDAPLPVADHHKASLKAMEINAPKYKKKMERIFKLHDLLLHLQPENLRLVYLLIPQIEFGLDKGFDDLVKVYLAYKIDDQSQCHEAAKTFLLAANVVSADHIVFSFEIGPFSAVMDVKDFRGNYPPAISVENHNASGGDAFCRMVISVDQ